MGGSIKIRVWFDPSCFHEKHLSVNQWYARDELDFTSSMIEGEAIFYKLNNHLDNCTNFWEKLLERDHLLIPYQQTPPLTLLSYKQFSLNINKPQVLVIFPLLPIYKDQKYHSCLLVNVNAESKNTLTLQNLPWERRFSILKNLQYFVFSVSNSLSNVIFLLIAIGI